MILNIPHEIYSALDNKNFFNELMNVQGECYRSQPSRKTSRVSLAGQDYFIKQHSGAGFREIFKNLLRARLPVIGAKNEWRALEKCQVIGIKTASLVGYGARGLHPARQKSFVITRPLEQMKNLEETMKAGIPFSYRRKILYQLAHMVSAFHQAGMCHRDMYICHFLLKPDPTPQLYMMDLHRVTIREEITKRDQLKNLAALLYSSFDGGFSLGDYLFFLKIYMNKPLVEIVQAPLLKKIFKRAYALYLKDQGYAPTLSLSMRVK